MSGSNSAVLAGLALPATAQPQWDHTYVASDCGWAWGCFGRRSGGRVLTSGPGDSFLANCLSKPRGTAGMTYGIDGVCHQAANRMLLPSGRRVSVARGYNISESLYGHYGRGPWRARLVFCRSLPSGSTELASSDDEDVRRSRVPKGSKMQDGRANGRSLAELMDFAEPARSEFVEVHAMCTSTLGHEVSAVEIKQLAFERITHRLEQQLLAYFLESEEIGREKYLDDMTSLVRRFASRNKEILGQERFSAVFGEAAEAPDGLIDRSIFLGEVRS